MKSTEMRVYKYIFNICSGEYNYAIDLPIGAKILDAQNVGGNVSMWYTFPENSTQTVQRKFRFIPTGYETVSIVATHIKTLQFLGGNFILHLFEL